jgi:hypothetical protein
MRPGQHGDRLRQFSVGGQPAMLASVTASAWSDFLPDIDERSR